MWELFDDLKVQPKILAPIFYGHTRIRRNTDTKGAFGGNRKYYRSRKIYRNILKEENR